MTHKQQLRLIIQNLIKEGFDSPADRENLQDIFSCFLDECEDTSPNHAFRLAESELEDIRHELGSRKEFNLTCSRKEDSFK